MLFAVLWGAISLAALGVIIENYDKDVSKTSAWYLTSCLILSGNILVVFMYIGYAIKIMLNLP